MRSALTEAMRPIVGLLLAAGSSRRFGRDKLLQPLPDGTPMVAASARILAAATDRVIVLVRPQQPALQEILTKLPVDVLEVADAAAGMGVTLAAGVRAAADAAGWVIALADMPCVQVGTVSAVVSALRKGAAIAAPFHCGRRGHPVGFAAHWFDALTSLDGDQGARNLLRAHGDSISRVEVLDPRCLFDVDTPSDLESLRL